MLWSAPPIFFRLPGGGELDLAVGEAIVGGMVEGCQQAGCALVGGETAEMPGMYQKGEYDVAGFAVGEVSKESLLDGTRVRPGDFIIGLPSSGFHSNGFALIRKLLRADERELQQACLRPTKIYVQAILSLLKKYPEEIKGLAHITGGGFDNIERINSQFSYEITEFSFLSQIPDHMQEICARSGLSRRELFKTFNMGIGMVVIASSEKILSDLEPSFLLGRVS